MRRNGSLVLPLKNEPGQVKGAVFLGFMVNSYWSILFQTNQNEENSHVGSISKATAQINKEPTWPEWTKDSLLKSAVFIVYTCLRLVTIGNRIIRYLPKQHSNLDKQLSVRCWYVNNNFIRNIFSIRMKRIITNEPILILIFFKTFFLKKSLRSL